MFCEGSHYMDKEKFDFNVLEAHNTDIKRNYIEWNIV